MASDKSFVLFVVEQMQNGGEIRYRKMFGEYAIYYNDKVVALVCDNQLFVKPTRAGELLIGEAIRQSPYPGAKPSFLIGDQIEDREWLCALIAATEKELPPAKPKKTKKKTRTKKK